MKAAEASLPVLLRSPKQGCCSFFTCYVDVMFFFLGFNFVLFFCPLRAVPCPFLLVPSPPVSVSASGAWTRHKPLF